jgi:hypothetical protein
MIYYGFGNMAYMVFLRFFALFKERRRIGEGKASILFSRSKRFFMAGYEG